MGYHPFPPNGLRLNSPDRPGDDRVNEHGTGKRQSTLTTLR